MAPLRSAAQFDPFLCLDCASTPSTKVKSTERKGIKFCHLATLHTIKSTFSVPNADGGPVVPSGAAAKIPQTDGFSGTASANHAVVIPIGGDGAATVAVIVDVRTGTGDKALKNGGK